MFECPHCEAEIDINLEPDYLTDMHNNEFTYECDCGKSFEVGVEWEPYFWVRDKIIRQRDSA